MKDNEDEKTKLVEKEEDKFTLGEKLLVLDLMLMTAMAVLCSNVQIPFMTRLVLQRKGGYIVAASLHTAQYLAVAMFGMTIGKYIPKYGYKKFLLFGVLLESFCYIGFALLHFVPGINWFSVLGIGLRFLGGVGNACAITAVYAIAGGVFDRNRGLVYGMVEASIGIGYIIGPVFGAFLFSIQPNMLLPILVPSVIYPFTCIRFALCFKNNNARDFTPVSWKKSWQMFSKFGIVIPVIALVIGNGSNSYLQVVLTAYLGIGHISVLTAGCYTILAAVCYCIWSPIIGKFNQSFSQHTKITMMVGYFLNLLPFVCFIGDYSKWVVSTGMILTGTGAAIVTLSSYTESLKQLLQANRDTNEIQITSHAAGIWTMFNNLGRFIFAIGGCLILDSGLTIPRTNIAVYIFSNFVGIIMLATYCINYLALRN